MTHGLTRLFCMAGICKISHSEYNNEVLFYLCTTVFMVTSDSMKAKTRRDDYKKKVSQRYSLKRKDMDVVSQDFSKTGKQDLSRILATEIQDKF